MKHIKTIIGLLLFSSLVMLVLLVVSLYFLFVTKNERKSEQRQFNHYQYLQFNSYTNQSLFGIVTLSENLQEDEYISLKKSSFEHLLISNIGSAEYRCSGTCFCENKEIKRRNSISILTRNIVYLVSAVSSIIAYQKASEYYEKECIESLEENDCSPPHAIRSSVEDCQTVTSLYYVDKENRLKDGEKMYEFLCEGKCSLRGTVPQTFQKWYEVSGGEEDLMNTLREKRDYCENLKYMFPESIGGVDDKSALDKALKSFSMKLRDYCEINSVIDKKHESLFHSSENGGEEEMFPWCTYNPKAAVQKTFQWDEKKYKSPKPIPPYAKCRGVID